MGDRRTCGPGIIPARAGFTQAGRPSHHGPRDHPRSRGVYSARCPTAGRKSGSSPLARGLPVKATKTPGRERIIPARAGFTQAPTASGGRHQDHPRSRGVYLTRRLIDVNKARIIPARAGFTARVRGSGRRARDHPRSRGVYCTRPCPRGPCAGSSPLARGLQAAGARDGDPRGIIPARAGFTPARHARAHRGGDHPRSRGVYRTTAAALAICSGSSPLARGLRHLLGGPGGHGGIIPARAGFTDSGGAAQRAGPDHPRSRGVYTCSLMLPSIGLGSSPLARGLQLREVVDL